MIMVIKKRNKTFFFIFILFWSMLKLKLQYFGQLMQRANLLEKTLMLGKTEGRRRDGWMASLTQWT